MDGVNVIVAGLFLGRTWCKISINDWFCKIIEKESKTSQNDRCKKHPPPDQHLVTPFPKIWKFTSRKDSVYSHGNKYHRQCQGDEECNLNSRVDFEVLKHKIIRTFSGL